MPMSTELWAEINGSDYGANGANRLDEFSVSPAGPAATGQAELVIIKDGGGYSFIPMQKVKLARKTSAHQFGQRLLSGVLAYMKQTQRLGTNTAEYTLRAQDVNRLGGTQIGIGTPNTFTYNLPAGTFAAQVQSLVSAVQNAYGGSPEAIDATSQVANLYATMPADVMEGGHLLGWYLNRLLQNLYRVSGIRGAYYFGFDPSAGATDFGSVVLWTYDVDNLPTATASFSTSPTGGQRGIRAFYREIDGTLIAVRKYGYWSNGAVVGFNSAANTLYGCPWSPIGGWQAETAKYDVQTSAEAQALVNADVATSSVPPETVRIIVDSIILKPGDVVDTELVLFGIPAGSKYRVAQTRTVFEDKISDLPLTELTLGLLPRSLGRNRTLVGTQPIYRDVTPPTRPATPTLFKNLYDPATGKTLIVVQCVSSDSPDTAAIQVQYTYNTRSYDTLWVPCSPSTNTLIPFFWVPRGTQVSVAARCYDTANPPNIGLYSATPLIFKSAIGVNS